MTTHFDPELSFGEKDMEAFQEWGLNVIRLGMMWPGAEPSKGNFNSTYFSLVKWIVEKANTYGIYTLLDAHQDVLSEKFCGEGVPLWVSLHPTNFADTL